MQRIDPGQVPAGSFAPRCPAPGRENADSRVKAGLHFRFATTAGLALGENEGRYAVRYSLTAID